MPWCDDCSKFWNPAEMGVGGTCPSCGLSLPVGAGAPVEVRQLGAEGAERAKCSEGSQAAVQLTEGAPDGVAEGTEGAAGISLPDGPVPVGTTPAKGAPWHFKLLVVGVTVYMIYRIYWLIEWLPKHV